MSDNRSDYANERFSSLYKLLKEERKEFSKIPIGIIKKSSNNTFLLSYAQERLWVVEQLESGSATYNIPCAFRLKGKLDEQALKNSFDKIIERHESLRTSFTMNNGQPVQVIASKLELELPLLALEEFTEKEREEKVDQLVSEGARHIFDLTHSPLIKVVLLRLSEEEHVLIINIHHIISDGWSEGILFKELSVLYEAFSAGKPFSLPEVKVQYTDFVYWERKWLQGEVLEKHINYWKEQLKGAPAILDLPADYKRPGVQTFQGESRSWTLSKAITEGLKELSKKEGTTLFMTLLAGFKVLLYRYAGQEDIIVGTPTAGRNRREVEGLIGFFVNTLALRTDLSGNPTFLELLGRVYHTALGAYAHQDLPFEKLVEVLRPERNSSYSPILQVMFAFQNYNKTPLNLAGLDISRMETETKTAKFDLTLAMEEGEEGLIGLFEYNTDLFRADTIDRMIGHFTVLLEGIINSPSKRIEDLLILPETEWYQLVEEWNNTKKNYPKDQCIHQLFEAQAERTPENMAVVYEDRKLSYGELNQRANQLANILRSRDVKPNSIVGIIAGRSPEMILGILGILKAGAAYLPIDLKYPAERINFMLQDCGAKVLLTEEEINSSITFEGEIIKLDLKESCRGTSGNLTNQNQPGDLAYVMYTSGSTGMPKGVMVEHHSVVRLIINTNFVHLTAKDRILQTAAPVFDVCTFEIWAALLNGLTLYQADESIIIAPDKLCLYLEKYSITTLWLTSQLFNQLSSENPEIFNSLKNLLVGGDVLSPQHINPVRQKCPGLQIINGYGPTENTTFSTCFTIDRDYEVNIPIGKPINNSTAYVVSRNNQLQPIGIPGELWVGGDGVARGYLNRPELTSEKFIPSPFRQEERVYRTGDQARWLPDGNIEFLGRTDHQVKIRGFRIELGEIESRLLKHEAIQEVLVTTKEDTPGNKNVCAYLVSEKELTVSELREFLAYKLPDYMIPSYFIQLDRFPLNSSGKIDRKVLPEPKEKINTGVEYQAPGNLAEKELAAIWEEILGISGISINDDFFQLGGNSLLVIRLIYKMEQRFDIKLPLAVIFNGGTIKKLAQIVTEEYREPFYSSLVPIQPSGSKLPLFFVHPILGDALLFNELARCLGQNQPFYGFQAVGLYDEKEPFTSIEEMAEHYIRELQMIQAKGPYFLGGYSAGCTIVFEMAQQLAKQGHNIASLIIVDGAAPDYYNKVFKMDEKEEIIMFFEELALSVGVELTDNVLEQLQGYTEWDVFLEEIKEFKIFSAYLDALKIPNRIKVFRGILRALKTYTPNIYNEPVIIFRAMEGYAIKECKLLGWEEIVMSITVHEISGSHYSIIKEPNVRILGDKIKDCLEDIASAPAYCYLK